MDPRTSAQDVMRCDLCETAVVQMHCDTCLVNLCKACVGEHTISDESKKHEIVTSSLRKSTPLYPGCNFHVKEQCEMYCNQCDIPVCVTCIASDKHLGHDVLKILRVLDERKEKITKKQMELKQTICPTYMAIASDVQNRISQLEKDYGYLSTAMIEHGDTLHREISKLETKLQAEVREMKNKQLKTLQKHLDEITSTISDVKNEISFIETFVDSNDTTKLLDMNLTPNIDKYKNLPQKILPSLPKFTPGKILGEEISKVLGFLVPSSLTLEKHGYSMKTTQKSPEAGSSPPVKQLLDEPETLSIIDTGYENLLNVACRSDEEIWTSGTDNTMKLFSINQGSLIKSITTKSGNKLYDLAVTKNGDLVYTDHMDYSVNIVKNEGMEEIIKTQKWGPYSVCLTLSFDLLVIVYNIREKQSRVVRYSGSTKKQTIQFDDQGTPLYSTGFYYRHITENRNLDICVSDNKAGAVLRFRYTGHTGLIKNELFNPRGIATDSQSHILTVDDNSQCVHVIDQDGHFVRYVHVNGGLREPMGLCIDSNDYLFVAQYRNGKVKKIKYLQKKSNICSETITKKLH